MLKLSGGNFQKAEAYINCYGRPIERELFNYYLKNGSAEKVLLELVKFQNEDGGFGHGLESDVRSDKSSCFVTAVAFQILCELKVSSDNIIVKKGIEYLIKNFEPRFKGWLHFTPEVNEAPRAIWWNYDSNENSRYNPNPSAEIAGYLAKYRELVPESMVSEATSAAMEHLKQHIETLNMHEIFCYQRMADSLADYEKGMILNVLKKHVRSKIEFNPDNWSGYEARPLSYIHNPSDELISEIRLEEINMNLDYIVKGQQEEGHWIPNWTWSRFQEEWEVAKREWEGCITLENLRTLNEFERIEE